MAQAMKAAFGAALLLVAGSASAATISGGNQGFSVTAYTSGAGTPSQGMSFSQFNPALGTLTGVGVALVNPNGGAVVTAALQDGFFASVQASVAAQMSIAVAATTLFAGGYMANASCEVMEEALLPCSEQAFSFTPTGGSFTPATLALPDMFWAPFAGAGTVELTAAILELGFQTSLVAPFFGTDASHAMAQWSGLVEVTYSYTEAPAPEPASLALLGAGLGLLGLLRRRRRT